MDQNLASSLSKFINSPPGELMAGATIFGAVFKFFGGVEEVLNEQTKTQIADWLQHPKGTAERFRSLPPTLTSIFLRVFGAKQFSWFCVRRSLLATLSAFVLTTLIYTISFVGKVRASPMWIVGFSLTVVTGLMGAVIPDYLSIFKTRVLLRRLVASNGRGGLFALLCDALTDVVLGYLGVVVGSLLYATILWLLSAGPGAFSWHDVWQIASVPSPMHLDFNLRDDVQWLWFFPPFVASLWVWLFLGASAFLSITRRFDVGFIWFSRHFDVEKKPLKSLGLIGASFVTVFWFCFVVAEKVLL